VAVQAEVSDQGSDLTANATVTMQDATGQTINQTQTQNLQFTSTNQTQVQTLIQIPDNATAGQGTINLAIYAETYNGTDIPAAANQNVQFTISSDGNVTATTTSSPTPTPGPTVLPLVYQNAMGLFSWLLVATGLFTFTGLTMFLRRKTVQTGPQLPLPNIPITSTNSTVDTQPVQTPLQEPSPTPKTSTDKIMQAAVTTEQLPTVYETWNATPTQASKPEKEIDLTQEPAAQATSALSSRISSATKRIQAIKSILESEMEQLAQEVTELNKIVNERERAVKDYFETLREETEKAKRLLNSNEDTLDETTKPISAPNLSEEPTLQAILTYRSRIANTEKIIQALNISLKIEKEKLAPDLMEFNKQIDEREKALKKYIDALRRESEKAQTYLNGKEK